MPQKPKPVTVEIVESDHLTDYDRKVMEMIGGCVSGDVQEAYQDGYIVTVEQVPLSGMPCQGHFGLKVSVRKENPVR